ncbi:MAG: hypothetical protein EOP45_14105, partial [Sphingobacteriaceae bacterium]
MLKLLACLYLISFLRFLLHSFKMTRDYKIKRIAKITKSSTAVGECIHWNFKYQKNGYARSGVNGRSYYLHRIVYWCHSQYEEMKDIPTKDLEGNTLQLRHLCGDSKCIKIEHLRLGTISENNYEDKISSGTLRMGESHSMAKFKESTIKAIISLIKLNTKTRDIIDQFGISKTHLHKIKHREIWTHLWEDGSLTQIRKSKSKVQSIRRKINNARVWTKEKYIIAKQIIDDNYEEKLQAADVEGPCHIWTGKIKDGYG